MPERYFAAAYVAKCLMLSSIGTAMTLVGAAVTTAQSESLWSQLNKTQIYMGLHLPLWWFLVACVLLSFLGAFWSLTTDTLRGKGSVTGKILTATTVGLVGSFIITPAATETPNMIVMMAVSLLGSYAGTVLLYLTARLLNDQQLLDDVSDATKSSLVNALKWVLSKLPGGTS